jgi:CRP-like cAMP-binding protein
MTIEDDIAFLERVPALSILGRDALRIIAIGSESRYVHEGNALFGEGDDADGAYVVQEGSFELVAKRNGRISPTVVGRGALIGELALLTETKRPVSAIAREPSSVVRIPRQLFLKTLEGYPDAAVRMRDAMAARSSQTAGEFLKVRTGLAGAPPRR